MTQGEEKQAIEMKLSSLEATHEGTSSTLSDLQSTHSELQEKMNLHLQEHEAHKSEATLRDNENAKALSKANFDLETKVQIEEKLRAQILEHAESHKASQSQLETKLQGKIDQLDQENEEFLTQIASLKTTSAALDSEKDRALQDVASATQKIAELEAAIISKTEDHTAAVDSHSNEAKNLK